MDIIISDNWLREFLITPATPKQIAQYVSLCGPSIDKIEKVNGDTLYHVEITTNRIDTVSIYGFAREAAAILPRFKISAKLKPLSVNKNIKVIDNLPFKIISNQKLVKRAMGVILTNIKNWETPEWMEKRLTSAGVRSLNAVVDITNYIMLEVGQPSHAFDYDKIKYKKFVIRESKKGESLTGFDGKTHNLLGGDIVFDDGEGEIIDLPGIIGTKNSVVDTNSKRILFFIDNNDPVRIRNTSMGLSIRTMAAAINEKGVDPELGETAIYRGIELFRQICKAEVAGKIIDFYPNPYKEKKVVTDKAFIDKCLGIVITKDEIEKYLTSLQFNPKWSGEIMSVTIPSFRADDINIPEDLIEEIARIYGYHNFPNSLMAGSLPDPLYKSQLPFELIVKNILKALGAIEVYTLSLVPAEFINQNALKLANPLGKDTEYLRTSLKPSLVQAVNDNKGEKTSMHLFEMSNVYKPKKGDLPDEKMMLAGIFSGYDYRKAKGAVETLLNELNISTTWTPEDSGGYQASRHILIKSRHLTVGELGVNEKSDHIYYQFDMESLTKLHNPYTSFKPLPKYPPQIEDITLVIPEKTKVGEVLSSIKSVDAIVYNVELGTIYKNAYTFSVQYQHPEKTLTNEDVKTVREKILKVVSNKFGAMPKS